MKFKSLINKFLDYPKVTLSLLAIVTIIMGAYLPNLKMDFSIEQLFSQDDPVIDRFLQFREEFDGVDNIVYLLYESDDPFSYENLIKNRKMVNSFEKINGVSNVSSLTNIDLFNTDVVIFVDDIHREAEASLLNSLSEILGRPATTVEAKSGAKFGYL